MAGELSFDALKNTYPFILALPQATTVELLENRLTEELSVALRRNTNLVEIAQSEGGVTATIQKQGDAEVEQVTASFLVGCDGHRSKVREMAVISISGEKRYPVHFMMAGFADDTDLGDEAHLFFSRRGSIESFPLPERCRRWIVQTELGPGPRLDLMRPIPGGNR